MRVFSTLKPRSNENKSCMRVEKREFAWEFSQLSCPGQTKTRVARELRSESLHKSFLNSEAPVKRTRVAWELRSENLHESFLNSHAPVKRKQELHESWEARVCMRVFSTLIYAPVKRKQELHESWEARVCTRVFSTLMPQSNENKSCMKVEKREFAWEFSQPSCPGQTKTRVAWKLRSESLHESFLNSEAPQPRLIKQELHESCWLSVDGILPVKRVKTLINSHHNLNQLKVDESAWESMTVGCETRVIVGTLINSHHGLTRATPLWPLFDQGYPTVTPLIPH
jgi:hypothetical protein